MTGARPTWFGTRASPGRRPAVATIRVMNAVAATLLVAGGPAVLARSLAGPDVARPADVRTTGLLAVLTGPAVLVARYRLPRWSYHLVLVWGTLLVTAVVRFTAGSPTAAAVLATLSLSRSSTTGPGGRRATGCSRPPPSVGGPCWSPARSSPAMATSSPWPCLVSSPTRPRWSSRDSAAPSGTAPAPNRTPRCASWGGVSPRGISTVGGGARRRGARRPAPRHGHRGSARIGRSARIGGPVQVGRYQRRRRLTQPGRTRVGGQRR